MSEKIVVGTDGSDRAKHAVAEAIRIAKALGAELHVVTAGRPMQGAKIVGAPDAARAVYGPVEAGLRSALIEDALESARLAGITAEAHVRDDDPGDALVAVARELDADLVVVGNKGMSGGRRLLGSVPNKVSHEAPCSVLIVNTK
jgi:nucleotide-binding universal stress UspA family protein